MLAGRRSLGTALAVVLLLGLLPASVAASEHESTRFATFNA